MNMNKNNKHEMENDLKYVIGLDFEIWIYIIYIVKFELWILSVDVAFASNI